MADVDLFCVGVQTFVIHFCNLGPVVRDASVSVRVVVKGVLVV